MTTERCMTQTELAERWRISEATLERWRTEAFGPVFLKLGNQVRYRVQDVEAFEEVALRGSTKIDGGVDQTAIPRPLRARQGRSPSGCGPFHERPAFAPPLRVVNADGASLNLRLPSPALRLPAPDTPNPQCRRWGCSPPPVAASSGGSRPRRSRSGPFPGR